MFIYVYMVGADAGPFHANDIRGAVWLLVCAGMGRRCAKRTQSPDHPCHATRGPCKTRKNNIMKNTYTHIYSIHIDNIHIYTYM